MRIGGMLQWWNVGLSGLMSRFIRCADGDGGGGDAGGGDAGGGDAWYGSAEGMDAGVVETLNSFESRDAAFSALHAGRQPFADRVLGLDPELEAHKDTLARFENPATLAKSYMELRSKVGENPLVAPGDDATDDQKAEFATKLNTLRGVPENADGYQYELPDDVMKQIDPEQLKGRLGQLHEAGFDNSQVQAALNMFVEEAGYLTDKATEVQNGWKAESDAWRKEQWGNDADGNLELATRAMQKMGVLEDLQGTGFIHKQGVIDSFYQLAKTMGEGQLPNPGGGGGGSFEEQLAALQQLDAYKNPRHPDHAATMQKKAALYKKHF